MEISELRLLAADPAAQRAFYAGALGLPLLAEAPSSFAVGAGATRLVFEAASGSSPAYHFAFEVPENKLAAGKAWLAGRATLLTRDGQDTFTFASWNADAVYCRDPAGNIVELIARHNLANRANGPFGPRDLLGVSEIGLPTDDVPALVGSLTAELGLEPWREQSAGFAPLGDEQGLLIVVSAGRPWFPTDTPATVNPIALTLRGAREGQYHAPRLPYRVTLVAR